MPFDPFDKIKQIHRDFDDSMYTLGISELPDDAVFPEEIISEKIDNLSETIKEPLDRQIAAVESLADSALKTASASKHLANTSQLTADSANVLAKASEEIAKSAKLRADLALQKSQKADIKGWISVGISLAALIWSIIYPLIL